MSKRVDHDQEYDFDEEFDVETTEDGKRGPRRFKKNTEHTIEKKKKWDRENQYDRPYDYNDR